MDIYELLKKDHEEVMDLFEELEIEKGGRKTTRLDDLFDDLKNSLELHMIGEEEFFYPVLEETEELHSSILESRQEHHLVNLLIAELDNMPKDENWFAKLTVLKENVEHHVEHEEKEIFPKAEEILDPAQEEFIALNMEGMKKAQMAIL